MPTRFDSEMQQYFDTLPPYVQETIKHTRQDLKTKQELVECAENLMKGHCGSPPGK